MHHSSIDYLEQEHKLDGLFDGMVVSCRIRMVKPEPEIYDYLLETHALAASDTVFIDDTELNVVAAASRGIRAIRFENVGQCRRALAELGALGLN